MSAFRQFLSRPAQPPETACESEPPSASAESLRAVLATFDESAAKPQALSPQTKEPQPQTPAPAPAQTVNEEETALEKSLELTVDQLIMLKQRLLIDATTAETAGERTAASRALLQYSVRTKQERRKAGDVGGNRTIFAVVNHIQEARKLASAHEYELPTDVR